MGAFFYLCIEHAGEGHIAYIDRFTGKLFIRVDTRRLFPDGHECTRTYIVRHASAPLCR
jgi:hypothetical protein